jgi:transposase
VVAILRAGGSVEVAVRVAGIGASTHYRWMERGRGTRAADAPYRLYREAVEAAVAEAEALRVAQVVRSATMDWRAAAWLLERQVPERWAPRERRSRVGEEDPRLA